MTQPSFKQLAQMKTGPMTLVRAIQGVTVDGVQLSRPVRAVLNDWTDSDAFVELFRVAREGGDVPDDRFVESLAGRPAVRTAHDPFGSARAIVRALLMNWYRHAYERAGTSNAPPATFAPAAGGPTADAPAPPPSTDNPWYSLIVSLVAVLGMFGGVLGIIGVAVSLASGLSGPSLGAGLAEFTLFFGAIGFVLCGVMIWVSWALYKRENWSRIVHIVLYAIGIPISAVTALLTASLLEFASLIIQGGVLYVLTRPETKDEFTKTGGGAE